MIQIISPSWTGRRALSRQNIMDRVSTNDCTLIWAKGHIDNNASGGKFSHKACIPYTQMASRLIGSEGSER